jgi:hypothetical protein
VVTTCSVLAAWEVHDAPATLVYTHTSQVLGSEPCCTRVLCTGASNVHMSVPYTRSRSACYIRMSGWMVARSWILSLAVKCADCRNRNPDAPGSSQEPAGRSMLRFLICFHTCLVRAIRVVLMLASLRGYALVIETLSYVVRCKKGRK